VKFAASTLRILASAAVLAVAAPATVAATQQQDQQQAVPAPQAKAERPICRTISPATGSRLEAGERICLTREQWRQRRERPAGSQADRVQRDED
jgi:hypothetical protein